MALRCMLFCSSRTRPDAARSAFEGTQPLFTHVPPMSWPSMTAVLRPCRLCAVSSADLLVSIIMRLDKEVSMRHKSTVTNL